MQAPEADPDPTGLSWLSSLTRSTHAYLSSDQTEWRSVSWMTSLQAVALAQEQLFHCPLMQKVCEEEAPLLN